MYQIKVEKWGFQFTAICFISPDGSFVRFSIEYGKFHLLEVKPRAWGLDTGKFDTFKLNLIDN